MADLLAHVLVPYVLLTVAGWRIERLEKRWVVVAMGGAAVPDLVKVDLLVADHLVSEALGVPFEYDPISSLGGVLVVAAAIAVLFERERRRAYAALVFGGATALVVDGLRVFADGRADFWLYPFTWWRPPTPSLYVTSDPTVTAVAVAAAAVAFLVDRWREGAPPWPGGS